MACRSSQPILRSAAAPRPFATRSPHAVNSSVSIALSRLVIGTRWVTGAKVAAHQGRGASGAIRPEDATGDAAAVAPAFFEDGSKSI